MPERVSAWSGDLDGQGASTSWGTLVRGGQTFPFAIRWKPVDQRHAAISEVVPCCDDGVLALLPESAVPAAEPNLLRPPKPASRLDAVGTSLWTVALPTVGLPMVVRCLAAWWRPAVQEAVSGLPAATVAAALVYIVARHLPLRPLKDEVARSYGIPTAALTRAQRRLEGALGAGR